MSTRNSLRPAVVVLLAAAVAACGGADGSEPAGGADGENASARVINVEVTEMQPRAFTEYVNLTGAVAADRDVVVSAEESGVVRELFVQKGSAVRTGQPIARIDDRVLAAQADQARAQAEFARETWERQRRLWEVDSIGSEMLYIQARQGWQTADAHARALAERVRRATVRAPIDGVIEDRMVEVGSMVAPGAPIARVIDVNPVKVIAGVPERYAGSVSTGAPAGMRVSALGGREFGGRVAFVGAAVDPASRTVPIEIAVPNPGGLLRPGMVAEVRVESALREQALLVPQEAVQRSETGYYVYVVVETANGPIAESRPVVLGDSQGGWVPVENGLAAGDRVVVVGQLQVAAGDRVNVVGEAAD
ncbi:MAG TPA: efflux RND transporter periplasmic adaptor subunit [Longimicrobiales bacterium]|nr:efflux RND transporter periplasmic adaptor subunit [Longimicrobiales bacterium]